MKLLVFLLLLAVPCWGQSLEGTWRTSGQLPASGPKSQPFSWMKEYTFQAETYLMTGYPPIEETGMYSVTSRQGLVWKVRLFERLFQREPSGETTLELQWAEDGASFTIGKDRYFSQKPRLR